MGVAVHQVGHWLGLKHTFQSADEGLGRAVCGDEGEGDLVADTPMHSLGEGVEWGECEGEVDSCPEEEVSVFLCPFAFCVCAYVWW